MKQKNPEEAKKTCEEIISTMRGAIVGKDALLQKILAGFLAGGHILIEDVPGVAKTLIANCFAQVMDLDFGRVQFLPDLLPGDITGGYFYDARTGEFVFRKGPLFTGLLLADEVNRGTPKTQSALLEAMQERRVTVEGNTFDLPQPFLVIATQNPIEFDGTYPLPEAQLDRFIMRLEVGYPTIEEEAEVLYNRTKRSQDEISLTKTISRDEFTHLQVMAEDIYIHKDILDYISRLTQATRGLDYVEVGASPRGSLAIFKLCRALALIKGRDFVIPEDIKEVIKPALVHRIILTPEARIERRSITKLIDQVLREVTPPPIHGREPS